MGLTAADASVEVNFDGLVGPTHNFAGLSAGNVASLTSEGSVSHPRAAALEGIAKMSAVAALGVRQAVLPPQLRPSLATLHALGFRGSPEAVLAAVAAREPRLLRQVSSASAMWAANAATVAPASDTFDSRTHIVSANLRYMFHRSIEASTTRDVLQAIFRDPSRFAVHEPLPGGAHFADEGAANHTRLLSADGRALHLFAWGRSAFEPARATTETHPARQTREASQAVARLLGLEESAALLWQQHPAGIDAGAFHTDVLAVGNESLLLAHELAFVDRDALALELSSRLGSGFRCVWATNAELPVADAVKAYPFNSQLLTVRRSPKLEMVIVAPTESRDTPSARRFLERVVAEDNPVTGIVYLDVRQSMKNGGGPACLRQRVVLRESDLAALSGRVVFDTALESTLSAWIGRHYRSRLEPHDLADPLLYRESLAALDELTELLGLGPVYEFQR